jgi:alkylation response protein AidB-like acyl-CoA dehydrogenase
MDFTLTSEQELIRASARELCERELLPHARAWDEAEELPRSLVGTLAEAGFLAAGLPEELGGGGLDSVSYCLLCEELGKADSSVRGIVSVSNGLFGKTVAKWGSDEQKQAHLPALASGEALGCYALTEPGCGSDAAALATRAEPDGDGWALTGSKVFITLGSWAATAIVFARTGGPGPKGISAFLVPTGAAGFEARPMKGKLGLRAQDTAELSLDGVRVPGDAMLGSEGEGFKVAMSALDNGRISLADAGRPYTVEAAIAKWYASEAAVRAANAAVQVLGGYGYVDEYPVAKYLRDARVTTLYEGTSQIQTLIVGRALTGEPAFT